MLEYLLNTSTKVFSQYCPMREGHRRGAVLRSKCEAAWPSPISNWTGREPVNESGEQEDN